MGGQFGCVKLSAVAAAVSFYSVLFFVFRGMLSDQRRTQVFTRLRYSFVREDFFIVAPSKL